MCTSPEIVFAEFSFSNPAASRLVTQARHSPGLQLKPETPNSPVHGLGMPRDIAALGGENQLLYQVYHDTSVLTPAAVVPAVPFGAITKMV